VRDFYANLYKIPPEQKPAPDGCIEEFLGEEICNSEIVKKAESLRNKESSWNAR
jgi:hypothetical protein